jgi:integrase
MNNDITLAELLEQIRAIQTALASPVYDILGISSADIKETMNKKKKAYVDKVHHRSIHPQTRRHKNGYTYELWVTKDKKGSYITAVTVDALYEKLYEYYTGGKGEKWNNATLEELYKTFPAWKSEEGITGKTLSIRRQHWNKYFAGTEIVKRSIESLRTKDWQVFFKQMVAEHHLKKKQFTDIKALINGLYEYAIDEEIVSTNPLRDLNCKRLPYVKTSKYHEVLAPAFHLQDEEKVMDWCREEMKDPRKKKLYYYAIMLNWNCGLRFGELAALRWEDYDTVDQYLEISGQSIETSEMQKDGSFKTIRRHRVEYLKGNEAARKIGLRPRDIQVLEEIRDLHLSETEIFPEGFFRYGTYNGKIKLLAKALGYCPKGYRTHSLRTTAMTKDYDETLDMVHTQMKGGHADPAMTRMYVKRTGIY